MSLIPSNTSSYLSIMALTSYTISYDSVMVATGGGDGLRDYFSKNSRLGLNEIRSLTPANTSSYLSIMALTSYKISFDYVVVTTAADTALETNFGLTDVYIDLGKCR